jgi:pimeloyl-ACP methyl ester carboxylesterase
MGSAKHPIMRVRFTTIASLAASPSIGRTDPSVPPSNLEDMPSLLRKQPLMYWLWLEVDGNWGPGLGRHRNQGSSADVGVHGECSIRREDDMLAWLLQFLARLQRLLADLYIRLHYPFEPVPPSCPIGWQPSALAPVFYGVRDYGTADGAPGPCRVFFPSLDGAVFDAPILEGCGRYPLILFAHGHCDETDHFKKWYQLPAQLARSGYVVVAPEMPGIGSLPSNENHAAPHHMIQIVGWMRDGWEHRRVLLPPPATGVGGHSYGALLAARFAVANPVAAYVSIAGKWIDWRTSPLPIQTLGIPMLFCLGTPMTDGFGSLSDSLWSGLAQPRHKAVFEEAGHWDFLPPGATSCEGGLWQERGPCTLTGTLTADLVTMFFAKYLPPESWPALGNQIPASLFPPTLVLSAEQEFFAGGHLRAFSLLGRSRPSCRVTLTWATPAESGTATPGFAFRGRRGR